MSQTVEKKTVCQCENCGSEGEMTVTCSLEDVEAAEKAPKEAPAVQEKANESAPKVKGTGVCTHCGNEADMWIDI